MTWRSTRRFSLPLKWSSSSPWCWSSPGEPVAEEIINLLSSNAH
jgi:hypothetical protein